MARNRSLIEQAVLDVVKSLPISAKVGADPWDILDGIRSAVERQLREETVQRDHRRRREARDLCAGLEGTVVVDANAQIAHDVEYDGCKGAWVTASVFVRDSAVEDE